MKWQTPKILPLSVNSISIHLVTSTSNWLFVYNSKCLQGMLRQMCAP